MAQGIAAGVQAPSRSFRPRTPLGVFAVGPELLFTGHCDALLLLTHFRCFTPLVTPPTTVILVEPAAASLARVDHALEHLQGTAIVLGRLGVKLRFTDAILAQTRPDLFPFLWVLAEVSDGHLFASFELQSGRNLLQKMRDRRDHAAANERVGRAPEDLLLPKLRDQVVDRDPVRHGLGLAFVDHRRKQVPIEIWVLAVQERRLREQAFELSRDLAFSNFLGRFFDFFLHGKSDLVAPEAGTPHYA